MYRNIFILIVLLVSWSLSCEKGDTGAPKKMDRVENPPATEQVQKMAPDFKLVDAEGDTIQLSRLRGKLVIVDFWATWCGPCRMEIPGFVQLYEKYRDKGLEIIGISLDQNGWEAVKPFAEQYKINYHIVLGTPEITAAFGGIQAIPTKFIISPEGKILEKVIGYRPHEFFEEKIKAYLPG